MSKPVVRCHLCAEPIRVPGMPHACAHGTPCTMRVVYADRHTASPRAHRVNEPNCPLCRRAFRKQLKIPGTEA